MRVDAEITDLRLLGIEFDAKTLRVIAQANGTANVTVRLHDNGGTANGGADTSAPQTFTVMRLLPGRSVTAAAKRSMMGFGVPAGANAPHQA